MNKESWWERLEDSESLTIEINIKKVEREIWRERMKESVESWDRMKERVRFRERMKKEIWWENEG